MATSPPDTDVVILGAGPAGSCCALRLLQLGYRVTLVERARFPRAQIGESLTPGIGGILDLLGVRAQVDALPRSAGAAWLVWEHADPAPRAAAHGNAMVDRASFDEVLFQAVAQRGGRCLQGAGMTALSGTPGAWQVRLATAHGIDTVAARFVVDATGRRNTDGALRTASAAPLLALWTDLERGPCANLVEACPDGWLWGAARPDGRFRIMAFGDPAGVRGQRPDRWLAAQLARSRLFPVAAGAVRPGAVQACAATPAFSEAAWQPGVVRTGDAAFCIDPLSSSGVEKAMRCSLQAAVAVHTVLADAADESLARTFYEHRLAESIATHRAWAQRYYNMAWPDDASPFWRARRQDFAITPKSGSTLARLVAHTPAPARAPAPEPGRLLRGAVRRCDALDVVDEPCVVDDRIQLRRAIAHPNLPRPVAFVEGAEIVPLLDVLAAVPLLETAVELWSYRMPPARATRIAAWLCEQRLVRAVG
jgi:flavin-dependent dehydrogenase